MVDSSPQRVLVADDYAPTRATVRRALEAGGWEVTGEAADAAGAVAMVSSTAPDVALLDVRMPGGGIAAAQAIGRIRPETAVVMLTVSADDDDLFAALRVGALGYILKGGDPADLPVALRHVVSGEAVLDTGMLTRLVREFRVRERRRLFRGGSRPRLSEREREVLALLAGGASTAEIAERLYIAKVTVRSHIAAICRKMQLPDRASVIRQLDADDLAPPRVPLRGGTDSRA